MQQFTIRQATSIDDIYNIDHMCFSEGEAYSRPVIRHIMASTNNIFNYEAVDPDGKIIGYLLTFYEEPKRNSELLKKSVNIKDYLTVASLAVSQEFRSHGVATRLIKRLIEDTSNTDIKGLILQCRISNQVAQHIYEKCGFIRNNELLKEYYSDPVEDGYFMHLIFDKNISSCIAQ